MHTINAGDCFRSVHGLAVERLFPFEAFGAVTPQASFTNIVERFSVEGLTNTATVDAGQADRFLATFYGTGRDDHGMVEDSPQRAECFGDDDYFLRDAKTCFPSLDAADDARFFRKKLALESLIGGCERGKRDLINKLPDELLCEIFSWLPTARDQAACASVSMRWLMLQSHIDRDNFKVNPGKQSINTASAGTQTASEVTQFGSGEVHDEAFSHTLVEPSLEVGMKGKGDERRVERQPQWAIGDLSRCLKGKRATDVRLAAVAVGTGARGGLGKLSLRGGSVNSLEKGASDLGLSAIGFCCPALRSLSLWDCPYIRDEGLAVIGKGCRLLQKVDLLECPAVGDAGLQAIAMNCPLLSDLSLESCGQIGNRAMKTVGEYSTSLLSLRIHNCPLIGDEGLTGLILNAKKLKKIQLKAVEVGDTTLALLGQHCNGLALLSLESLKVISENGFVLFGKSLGMQNLKRLRISSCPGFTDCALGSLGDSCKGLKHASLGNCEKIADRGLMNFLQNASSLEILQLERCNSISNKGLIAVMATCNSKLRELQIRKCDGIEDRGISFLGIPSWESGVKSICISQCRGVGNKCLALTGYMCKQLTELDLSGLVNISDEGLLALLQCGASGITSLNFSGCANVTDLAVCAIAKQCGKSLQNLVLDGCKMVTDKSLEVIAKHCVFLQDLDVSQCEVTDKGLMTILVERGRGLSSLNLSGCRRVTKKILPLIERNCQSLVGLNLKHCVGFSQELLDSFESRLWRCDVLCS